MTAEELAKMPEQELRREVTRVLDKGPWRHEWVLDMTEIPIGDGRYRSVIDRAKWKCSKESCEVAVVLPEPQPPNTMGCVWVGHMIREKWAKEFAEVADCKVPPPAEGSMADLAERLKNILMDKQRQKAIRVAKQVSESTHISNSCATYWLAFQASAEQVVICCLLALQEGQR